MKQQVDSFFNKKLKDYSGEVPTSAWDRVDVNLSQKKKPFIWLKIAASLLLIAVAGFIVYTTFERAVQPIAVVEKTLPPVEEELKSEMPMAPAVEEVQVLEPSTKFPETTQTPHTTRKKEIQKEAIEPVEKQVEMTIEPLVIITENSIDLTREVNETPIETEIENSTILISSDEANAKYLDQQYIADATPENKKSSKIRNLFEKAQDLDPIGEFRQFKNEVLALNFRNEKKGERNR